MHKVVYKPWGKEEWLALNEFYCYKRIYLNKGYKTSYQYHEQKVETNYIIKGKAEVWLENDEGVVEKKIMEAGEFFDVHPPKKHRVIALTDVILQEVSTPHVDDVIRINDEFDRGDGKIEAEHQVPAILILAAGEGTRLGDLTKHINKALIPIQNQAIISKIINQFPQEYDIVMAIGYKEDSLKEYCQLAHPNRNFTFISVDYSKGPGYSAWKCKEVLQRPFYLTTADCLLKDQLPLLDTNWIGVFPTSYPEKYSTAEVINGEVKAFTNKNNKGYNDAFIGVAGIRNFKEFWRQLGNDNEVVAAFSNPQEYPLKAKTLRWFDTGNLDDLNNAKTYFKDKPLSLSKKTNEITYHVGKRFIKFNNDPTISFNKSIRAGLLRDLIPSNFTSLGYFIAYDYAPGTTLYNWDQKEIYLKFLNKLDRIINSCTRLGTPQKHPDSIMFYIDKTQHRVDLFKYEYGINYYTKEYNINEKHYSSVESILNRIKFDDITEDLLYTKFHGDLQFDNIIYSKEKNDFIYIDWRDSFASSTQTGSIYYDLAKLYGGFLINYAEAKNPDYIKFSEDDLYEIKIGLGKEFPDLDFAKNEFIRWAIDSGFDFHKIKLITGLIFLNMAPLHDEKFGKYLWFRAITILQDYAN